MEAASWVTLAMAIVAIIGFIVRSILKPWSDAALASAEAFRKHVETIDEHLPKMVRKFDEQTDQLKSTVDANTASMDKGTEAIEKLTNSFDSARLGQICKGITDPELVKKIVREVLTERPDVAEKLSDRDYERLAAEIVRRNKGK